MSRVFAGEIRQNTFLQKLFFNKYFWILFCSYSFIFPIYRSVTRKLPEALPVYYQLPSYELTNQFGQKFGSNDLRGKIYLANFIFTRCTTTCPLNMSVMQKVQKRVRGLGTKIGIVSLSVDPEFDTPNILAKKADEYGINPYIWTLLTGDKAVIQKLIFDGFKVPIGNVEKNGAGLIEVAHSNKVVLVDTENRIRGFYDMDKVNIDKLMIDVGILINLPKNVTETNI